MTGKQIGYVRVSSVDQNTSRQLDGIALDKVFTDRCSGKDTDRPELKRMLEFVREGDTLHIHAMDRLARDLTDLRKLVTDLTSKGVAVRFEKENLVFTDKSDSMGQLLLSILGAVAQFERQLIRERQMEGIAIARRNGVYAGRKPSLKPEQIAELRTKVTMGIPKSRLAEEYGVSRQTIYSALA